MSPLPTVVKLAAGALDVVRRPVSGLVVLVYHRVGGRTGVRVDLPTDVFDAQMAELCATRHVVSLDDAVSALAAGLPVDDMVVVTFDDGTADFVDEALPVLVRHRVPATLYVATAHVDEARPFPDDGRPVTWSGLAEAAATGLVTIGSHTHGHVLLDRLSPDAVAEDLDRSIGLIGDRLGLGVRHFAYPKALAPAPGAERLVRERFRSAALAGTRANPAGSDPLRLRRTPIQTTDGTHWFRRKVAGGLALEDDLRRVVNRRRYAGATT